MDLDFAADGNLRELSGEKAWETIKNFAQGKKEWDNPPNIVSEPEIENLKVHANRLFGNENVWVQMHRGIPIEVEPLDKTPLEYLGLNTCNHGIPLSSKEIPSIDEPEPQPQPLPNCLSLDEMFDDDWGLESKEVSPLGKELSLFDRTNNGLESVLIRPIQCGGYGVLGFLEVGTTFDIFQNIHLLYLLYGVLVFSGYGVLIMFPLWSLVSAGTDTYKHLGQFAPLGGEQTAAQLLGVWVSIGHSSQWLWYSVYPSELAYKVTGGVSLGKKNLSEFDCFPSKSIELLDDVSRIASLGSEKLYREAVVLMIRSYLSKLSSIETNTEHVEGTQFTCIASVKDMDETKGWFYKSWGMCRKKINIINLIHETEYAVSHHIPAQLFQKANKQSSNSLLPPWAIVALIVLEFSEIMTLFRFTWTRVEVSGPSDWSDTNKDFNIEIIDLLYEGFDMLYFSKLFDADDGCSSPFGIMCNPVICEGLHY
ncbi:hypothetical protein Tco_0091326 [Tanacetum coccineum]